jgi:dolichol-phosphate mannosyltransferase
MYSISIVTAAFNECPGIIFLINNWLSFLRNHKKISNFEIIICDDFSDIEQFNLLLSNFSHLSEVIILRNLQNEGPGYSFNRAIAATKYDWTLITDSDGQFPIENLDTLIQILDSNSADIVLTYRNIKFDNLFNRIGQRLTNYICNKIFNVKLNDFSCAFKLIKTKLIKNIKLDARFMNYSLDHTAKILNLGLDYEEKLIICNPGIIKKRKFINEFNRAKNRSIYIFYLFILKQLTNKRIIF